MILLGTRRSQRSVLPVWKACLRPLLPNLRAPTFSSQRQRCFSLSKKTEQQTCEPAWGLAPPAWLASSTIQIPLPAATRNIPALPCPSPNHAATAFLKVGKKLSPYAFRLFANPGKALVSQGQFLD